MDKVYLALEDIHAYTSETYNAIFNVLDGVYDVTNCIIIMTSNVSYKKLNTTLIRPGRVNYIIKFDYMLPEIKQTMFDKLVPQFSSCKKEVIENIKDIKMTPALFETFLLQYVFETDPKLLMSKIPTLIASASQMNYENMAEDDENVLII